ncbi:hypothetical protein BCR44DRAFT_89525 [Catenaria anguillulae PL171]|uniref:Uncharacterized protein n=1 Tax=Catenaria anguillulae PL171 TaxID=765915 RepID=A0A1Y2HUN1_9FUNG|nr:hypothetical protein BCR44DRAFT_89525 [Catenaria anguillulae PL171]
MLDLRRPTFARATQQLWTNVTSLTLGPPLFANVPSAKDIDSLALLTTYSCLFPNVTSLTLEPYHMSIYDCLVSLDVFVLRHPSVGKPLQELTIYCQSAEPGYCYMTGRPPIKDQTGKLLRYSRISNGKPTHGHLRKLVFVDKAEYPQTPALYHDPSGDLAWHSALECAACQDSAHDLSTALCHTHIAIVSGHQHGRRHKRLFPARAKLARVLRGQRLLRGHDDPASRRGVLVQVPTAYVTYLWLSSDQVIKLPYVVPQEDKARGKRKKAAAQQRKPVDMESEGVWCMGDVGQVFMSDVKVPGEFDLAPVEDGVIVRQLPKADLGPNPDAAQNRIPKFGERCKCGKQHMGAMSSAGAAGSAGGKKAKLMRARKAKWAAKAVAAVTGKQSGASDEAEKVLAWMDPGDGGVVCEECDAERERVNRGRFGRRVLRCAKVTDSRAVFGDGVWPLTVVGVCKHGPKDFAPEFKEIWSESRTSAVFHDDP